MTESKLISDVARIIEKATSEIAKGNFDVKLPISSNDEIGEIAKSFNTMVEFFKAQIDELDEISQLCLKAGLEYRNLYDNSPDLYRLANADGIIVNCNRSYAQHLGYTEEEVIGTLVFAHLAENSIDDFFDLMK